MSKLGESLVVFDKEYDIYPLWLCPMLLPKEDARYPGLVHAPNNKTTLFVDIGAYGNPKSPNFSAMKSGKRVEEFVRQVKGYQALYADTYMSPEDFQKMFDHSLYNQLRSRYSCDGALPSIYEKTNRLARR